MSASAFFQKIFQRSVFISACLALQGCSLWNKKATPEPTISSTATVMGEPVLVQQDAYTQPGKPSIRAVPRRPEPKEKPMEESETPDNASLYVVCKGDTLTRIARRFHVSVFQLMQENHLKNKNKLQVGQVLSIPPSDHDSSSYVPSITEPMKGEHYYVQKGDTLTRIAAKYGTTVAALREWNHLTRDTIYVGQTLMVSGTINTQKKPSAVPSSQRTISGDTYQVQSGDTLWKIAKRCHLSVSELIQCNPQIDPDRLQIGQVLSIRKVSSVPSAVSQPSSKPIASIDPFASEPSPTVEVKENPKEEESEFKDLFEENKDMPMVPVNEKHE